MGRNIWKADLSKTFRKILQSAKEILGDRLWVASSCSLLHVPVNLEREKARIKELVIFCQRKNSRNCFAGKILNASEADFSHESTENRAALESHRTSQKLIIPQSRIVLLN